MSAVERARELEKQRREVLALGVEDTLQRAIAAVRELREIIDEQLKTSSLPPARS
jgi:hypothetical protein